MAARYYNIEKFEPSTGSRQLIQVIECNSSGVSLAENGAHSLFEFGSIRFIPNATTGGHFNIISLMGDVSIPFTFDNVVEWEGSAHAQTDTFGLFALITGDIVS